MKISFEKNLPHSALALAVMALFYGVYFTKMLIQKKHGIRTHQIGRRKEKTLHTIETLMGIATLAAPVAQLISVVFGWNYMPSGARFTGFCIGITGDVIFLISTIAMKDSWRAGIPDKDKTELVTSGIYKFSRNPAFLGFDFMYVGILLIYFNPVTAIFSLFAMVMLHLQILQEEKFLTATFGNAYTEYKKQVFRYIGRRKNQMKKAVIYIHGKGGNAEEAEHYKPLFVDCDVIGFDYKAATPWDAKTEFSDYFEIQKARYKSIILIANSIGAFFTMNALSDKNIDMAFFISPVTDMEKLIGNMMLWANVTEKELREKKSITTDFGETLSWEYLQYIRNHPVKWTIPTAILYGENDNLTDFETISKFSENINADLTVMKGGEHWFHTDEQMKFLDKWIRTKINLWNSTKNYGI